MSDNPYLTTINGDKASTSPGSVTSSGDMLTDNSLTGSAEWPCVRIGWFRANFTDSSNTWSISAGRDDIYTGHTFNNAGENSMLALTGVGHGSTNTHIRRFSTATVTGDAIDRATSAADGDSYTINETGLYAINYQDLSSSTDGTIGISKNLSGSDLTTGPTGTTNGEELAYTNAVANDYAQTSWTGKLNIGDIVYPHTDSDPNETNTGRTKFLIIKIG